MPNVYEIWLDLFARSRRFYLDPILESFINSPIAALAHLMTVTYFLIMTQSFDLAAIDIWISVSLSRNGARILDLDIIHLFFKVMVEFTKDGRKEVVVSVLSPIRG